MIRSSSLYCPEPIDRSLSIRSIPQSSRISRSRLSHRTALSRSLVFTSSPAAIPTNTTSNYSSIDHSLIHEPWIKAVIFLPIATRDHSELALSPLDNSLIWIRISGSQPRSIIAFSTRSSFRTRIPDHPFYDRCQFPRRFLIKPPSN